MTDALPPDACWTSLRGAPVHRLGEMPAECYTCAAHAKAEPKPPARPIRASKHPYVDTGGQRECVRVFRCMTCGDESIGLDKAEAHAREHDAKGALAGTCAAREQELRPIQHRVGGLAHVGEGCWCRMGAACPGSLRQQSEDNRRNAEARARRDTESLKRDLAEKRRGYIDEWLAEDEWARAKLANWSRRRVDSLRQARPSPAEAAIYGSGVHGMVDSSAAADEQRMGGTQPMNETYEDADAEYVAREIRKWGLPDESLVSVWERVEGFARAQADSEARRQANSAPPDKGNYYSRDAARRREQEECDARTGRKSGPATLGDTRLVGGVHGTDCACVACGLRREER